MAPMEYTLMVYNSNGKGTVLWKSVFGSGNRHGKRKKTFNVEDAISIKVSFMRYMKWARVIIPIVFVEIEMV